MALATLQPDTAPPRDRMVLLQQATAALARAVTVAQVAEAIVRQTVELLGAEGAALYHVPDGGRALERLRADGCPPELVEGLEALPVPVEASEGEVRCFDLQRTLLHDPSFQPAALVCVFLAVEGRTVGALCVAFRSRAVDEEERAFLLTLGRVCAQALRRARLYEEAERARADAARAADRAARLQAVAAALSQALTVDRVAEVIVSEGGSALGAIAGVVALSDGRELQLTHALGITEAERACLERVPLDAWHPLAEVARSGQPIWLESTEAWRARYPEIAKVLLPEHAASGCTPLVAEGRVIGALGFAFGPPRRLGADTRELLQSLGRQCAQSLERARLYQAERQAREEAEAAEAALSFLEQASTILAASLDWEATLRSVARLAVPVLADWCAVDLLEDGQLRRVAVHQIGPERPPVSLGDDAPLLRVLKTGEPALLPDGMEGLRAVGLGSCMVVPLRARRRTLGLVILASEAGERRHGEDELGLAIELARRAALAVENARLYDAEQRARRRAERAAARTARLQAMTATLSTAVAAAEVAQAVVAESVSALGASTGGAWRLDDDGETLTLMAQVRYPPESEAAFARVRLADPIPISDAVRAREPLFLANRADLAARYPALAAAVVHVDPEYSLVCLPLCSEDRVVGGLAFTFARPTPLDEDDRAFLLTLARQCAQALERARLREEEAKARLELSAAVRARDEFLSIASHELKTPLSALHLRIEGLLRIVRRAPSGLHPEKLRTRLEAIEEQIERQAKLINQLLDVSRITAGRVEIDREPLDLGALTQAVTFRFGEELAKAGCDLRLSIEPVVGRWDRARLEQVVTNLLSNAIKYGAGKPIEVSVRDAGSRARLSVRDHGIGIAPEHQARIFGRFERAVSERHYGGLGLGLWISRQIVEAHGGRIEVASRPGAGAVFLVELPRG